MGDIFSILRVSNRIEFDQILKKGGSTLSFVSPANYYAWHRVGFDPAVIDHLFIDSISLVRLMSWLEKPMRYRRRSFDFTSLAEEMFTFALKNAIPVLVIGSTQNKNAKARTNLVSRYPRLHLEGVHGYHDIPEIVCEIANFSTRHPAGLVLLSLGAPKQDMVLAEVSGQYQHLTFITSGGFVEQISEALDYYPMLIDRMNLRWLYRVYRMRSFAKVFQVFFGLALLVHKFRSQSQQDNRT